LAVSAIFKFITFCKVSITNFCVEILVDVQLDSHLINALGNEVVI